MKKIEVEIAGKVYEIEKLPFGKSKEWRAQYGDIIRQSVDGIQSVLSVFSRVDNFEELKGLGVDTLGETVHANSELVVTLLTEGPELALDGLCGYCQAIADDRERIENEADDEDILKAFLEVAKLAFPFVSGLASKMNESSNGQQEDGMPKN